MLTKLSQEENTVSYDQDLVTTPKRLQTPQLQRKSIPKQVCLTPQDKKKGVGYRWSDAENLKYIRFLKANKRIFYFELRQKKRKKIHCRLSEYLQTRDSLQCRSHHQKMIKKYGSIDNIITELEAEIKVSCACPEEEKVEEYKTESKIQLIDFSGLEMPNQKSVWEQAIGAFNSPVIDNLFL